MWIGLFNGDEIKTLIENALAKRRAFAIAQESYITSIVLPGLGQGNTAHDMTCAHLGCGISSYNQ